MLTGRATAVDGEDARPGQARTSAPSAARERILSTADRLFYREGIRAVGVERVIAESGVARVTFYRHFPAKDELVIAYVGRRLEEDRATLAELKASEPAARDILHAIARQLYEQAAATGFRGCPYSNVSTEFFDPDHPIRHATLKHRVWFKAEIESLLRDAGHSDPELAAEQLLMLRAGAMAIAGNNGWEKPMWDGFLQTWDSIVS
jgi:AcrR family transcriptional regulator